VEAHVLDREAVRPLDDGGERQLSVDPEEIDQVYVRLLGEAERG
jgi:hypothetical protein